ncbi:Splicing factor [Maudiozyma exigua]|uniref:Splicing factor n=1 Tax=Maudiozyma exigua TaxID=34358 RepID=A0A9P6WDF5_MAUEX|nr:Splicing factor [Kazachstania exigua]
MDKTHKRTIKQDNNELENRSKRLKNVHITDRSSNAVIVKNLPRSYNNSKIKKIFQDCGVVKSIETSDTLDRKARYARLEFNNHDEALAALTKTYKILGSNEIEVTLLKGNTIWMTNFPPSFGVKQLKNLFANIDVVPISIRLPSHKYNTNRRFCYVDVPSKEDSNKAINALNDMQLDGYKLVVKSSNPEERTKRTDAAVVERRELFIRNLNPNSLDKDTLNQIFSKFGTVESITIPTSSSEHYNGCAFITFYKKSDTVDALAMDKTEIDGREISVQLADNKAYMERKELIDILNTKNHVKQDMYASIYPISDRISKEQVRDFVLETDSINPDDIIRIYLATDYNGAIIKLQNHILAAKCCVALDQTKFMSKLVNVGTIFDLKNHKRQNNHKSRKEKTHKEQQNTSQKNIDGTNEKKKEAIETPATGENMSNDDFRKMFLGK